MLTVWVIAGDVLVVKPVLPLYATVIVWQATDSDEVTKVA